MTSAAKIKEEEEETKMSLSEERGEIDSGIMEDCEFGEVANSYPRQNKQEEVYKSYMSRWILTLTVVVLNIGNYSHWISYASVTSRVSHKIPEARYIASKTPAKTWMTFRKARYHSKGILDIR